MQCSQTLRSVLIEMVRPDMPCILGPGHVVGAVCHYIVEGRFISANVLAVQLLQYASVYQTCL